MKLLIPPRQEFIHPAPDAPTVLEATKREALGLRGNRIALEVQFQLHRIFNDIYQEIPQEVLTKLRYFQGLAFAGYYPSDRELLDLEKSPLPASLSEQILNFNHSIRNIIEAQNEHWKKTGYTGEQRMNHESQDTIGELAARLKDERIVVFGSARTKPGQPEYEGTRWLTKTLVECFPHEDGTTEQIITGGGPGMMEAANLGAMEGSWKHFQKLLEELRDSPHDGKILERILRFRQQFHSIGVGIILPHEQSWNAHLQLNTNHKGFSPRKVGLVSAVSGRSINHEKDQHINGDSCRKPAIFGVKGGYGTMDELFEVATLQQCGKMPKIPIFVVGKKMKNLMKRIADELLDMETISPKDPELFILCDDEIEALEKYMQYYYIQKTPLTQQAIDERRKEIGMLSRLKVSVQGIFNGNGKERSALPDRIKSLFSKERMNGNGA